MPLYDPDALKELVKREEFARPDMQQQITGWIEKDKLESYDLIAKVKEAGGLVTFADFGLQDPNAGNDASESKKKGS
jgi:hypothetical protein